MSDVETIVQLLRNVERRSRANRLRQELTLGLSSFLMFLIAVKVWDLFFPLEGMTVTYVVAACALVFTGYATWRLRQRGTLEDAAVSLDQAAGLRDELKTAFWFINNPRASEWVERQIQRAAINARSIDVGRAYPRTIPRASYLAAAMVVLFIGLNFVPVPANHNWLKLQAAPASDLTEEEKFEALSPSELESLQASISAGLAEIARNLSEADQLKNVARAIQEKQLELAAEELRNLAGQLGTGTLGSKQETLRSFRKASANSRPALEVLSQKFGEIAEAIESDDEAALQEAIESVGEELQRLEAELLARVKEWAEGQRSIEIHAPLSNDPAQLREGTTDSPAIQADSMGGGAPQGRGQAQGPREGAPTTLDVKLEQEILKGMETNVARSQVQLEEASKRERSTLDYRNVKSELSAAQKDVLNRHRIPWEYRPLIRSYFQAIRPPEKK